MALSGEVGGECVGSGLVTLQMKGTLPADGRHCLLSLGIGQPWEGQFLQCQQGPKMSMHHIYRK